MALRLLRGLKASPLGSGMAEWKSIVRRILRKGSALSELEDERIRKRSLALRYRICSGVDPGEILIEAFALVREAARRTLGMPHYEVQLLGGMALHHGCTAVMQTGEGKTLTATLPLYLAALAGKGAHLATANDYLAARDADLMRPVYELLGLSVAAVTGSSDRKQRREAYAADITYTTAKEIGFDFLRDRLLKRRSGESVGASWLKAMLDDRTEQNPNQAVQRDPWFALVDEADSILIDEARTPLIISSLPDEVARATIELYRWCAEVVDQFELDRDYDIDEKQNRVKLTAAGRRRVRKLPKGERLRETPILDIYQQIELALLVERNYVRDRHYVVRDGAIVIVDEFTGRLAEGRQWRAGIHQAIEAREGLEVSVTTGEAARITVQDLFLRYPHLAGMTGTAAHSEGELKQIYQLPVVEIPTHRPARRKAWPDRVFGTEIERWQAIADEIEQVHKTGRPVLVGTRSIDKSETLSRMLFERGIEHEVLNARQLEREAEIISQAGQVSRVTVATNMAGRGTDIQLSAPAIELGGLHVIVSELHESARIDRQLIGRCGRQGDPGTFRCFMSLEDDLLENALGVRRAARLKRYAGYPPAQLQRFSRLFRRAQSRLERKHYQARKMLLHREKVRRELQEEMGQDPFLDVAGAA